ncbi:transcription antitermination protein NusB [Cardinium endosymbiont of Tipula unca]|uniref:transcription antitermination protein NusB n=1 Tax=Cardinium endosymbiont of Tipula unca TaxID=3066216 RepID=UPI0030D21C8D
MENTLVARRFVRVKALQTLYAYTILQQAHKKDAIEQIEKDFKFDPFLHESNSKEQLAENKKLAVAFFCNEVELQTFSSLFTYGKNSTIERSVRNSLVYYRQTLLQNQALLQAGFTQSKEYIYADYLSILLLLVEWYKLSTSTLITHHSTLNNVLATHPLLKELYTNNNWLSSINHKCVSWVQEQDRVEHWYAQLIQSVEIPQDLLHVDKSVKLLEYIIQNIIFKNEQLKDFFSMKDLYWDEHKRIVKKMLLQTFTLLDVKDFAGFSLFWREIEARWLEEARFYDRLLKITVKNSSAYEGIIGQKAEKWDSERIVLIDKLIIKLALAEMLEFEEIPLKVSMNEYIEIAKLYGTPKSGNFVNGVLEGIFKGLQVDIRS